MDVIVIDKTSKSFGSFLAVDNLSVTVPQGIVYGFLGPNGAGKTTTIRMIMNIIRPDSGKISIFGDGISAVNQNRISYMPEERGLYRKMTCGKGSGIFRLSKRHFRTAAFQPASLSGLTRWDCPNVQIKRLRSFPRVCSRNCSLPSPQ